QTTMFSAMQWMVRDGGMYQVCGRTTPVLPAGAYTCTRDCYGNPVCLAKNLQVDDLIDFAGSLSTRVLQEIGNFWEQGERFRKHGFLHRRGYLFYGKQGSGKSSLIHLIVARIVAAEHLAFFCEDPANFIHSLSVFRQVEPRRPMVCVFED